MHRAADAALSALRERFGGGAAAAAPSSPPPPARPPRCRVDCADLLLFDWSDADVIYMNVRAFPRSARAGRPLSVGRSVDSRPCVAARGAAAAAVAEGPAVRRRPQCALYQ